MGSTKRSRDAWFRGYHIADGSAFISCRAVIWPSSLRLRDVGHCKRHACTHWPPTGDLAFYNTKIVLALMVWPNLAGNHKVYTVWPHTGGTNRRFRISSRITFLWTQAFCLVHVVIRSLTQPNRRLFGDSFGRSVLILRNWKQAKCSWVFSVHPLKYTQ